MGTSDLDAHARRGEREERARYEKDRARLEKENQEYREREARLIKRMKLMQTTIVMQQEALDRYQKELAKARADRRGGAEEGDEENVSPNSTMDKSDQVDGATELPVPKRVKSDDGRKQRHSLPLADRHSSDHHQSSPSRRRSLPEPSHQTSSSNVVVEAADTWTTRRLDMESRRPVINASALLRPRPAVHLHSSPSTTHVKHLPDRSQTNSSDDFLDDFREGDSKKSVVVTAEPLPNERRTITQAHTDARDQQQRPFYRKRQLPFKSDVSKLKHGVPSPERATSKEPSYAYVEVVRNREERAALPGHDCIECRKYYEALGGIVSEEEIKSKCSRHRARFQPYQTPDDFWRLSFPDSQTQPHSP